METQSQVVSVRFGKSDNTYDYFCHFPVEVGQRVRVMTRNGWAKVEVVEIKAESDRANQSVIPLADSTEEEGR